jgi:hypothetical protein
MPWTPEEARAAGKKGGETRWANERARREFLESLTPEELQRHVLKENAFEVAQELVDAALGRGDFAPHTFKYEDDEGTKHTEYIEGLAAADRLKAINIFMTFSAPKPKPSEKKDETEPVASGFAISVGDRATGPVDERNDEAVSS